MSSCKIFEKVATALQWIVTHKTGNHLISHFLDKFSLLGKSHHDVQLFIDQFCAIMKRIGMPVVEEKTLGPTQMLEYLGLILNFLIQVIEIPEKKRIKCLLIVNKLQSAFVEKKKVTVKDIQRAAGNLNFICQALPAGRVFLCSLYRLTWGTDGQKAKAGHHRCICCETYDDLSMFAEFLSERASQHTNSIPFLNKLQVYNTD